MPNSYEKSLKQEIKEWTLTKLNNDPYLYGGDIGNPAIIKAYLVEVNPDIKVKDLTFETISNSVAVSRCKNKLLEDNPHLDFREVHKPKKRFVTKEV
jgi:hypothetical protein